MPIVVGRMTCELPIEGREDPFPVRRIFCIGRNYLAHGGNRHDREPPIFFTKFSTALLPGGGAMPYPPATNDLHHEVELVIALRDAGFRIPVAEALDHVEGYAVGLDMTRRDILSTAQKAGRPWDMAKNFTFAAPAGKLRPVTTHGHVTDGAIRLTVNGETRQEGHLRDMIWSPAEIIAELSALEPLLPGDLIFTGTPAGVGPVQIGDRMEATIDGLAPLHVEVSDAR